MKTFNSYLLRSISIRRFFVTLICILWFGALTIRAADRYAATNGTDSGACTNWANPASNIQYAVDLATNADDKVWVSNGAYRVTNQITITNKITVINASTNGYSNTLVYADWPTYTTRCFYVANSGVVDGFTISNGHFFGSNDWEGGGGAFISNGMVYNCWFRNNICSNSGTYSGGGGAMVKGGGVITNSIFYFNRCYTKSWGGGILLCGGSVLNCTIVSNHRYYGTVDGHGIAIKDPGGAQRNSILSNSLIADSLGDGNGAAVWLDYKTNNSMGGIVGCTIRDNGRSDTPLGGIGVNGGYIRDCLIRSNYYGGLTINNNGIIVSNCVIVGNSRKTSGGGGLNYYAGSTITPLMLYDCVFSNNSCGGAGGGCWIYQNAFLRNCVFYNNSSTNNYGGGAYLDSISTPTGHVVNCTFVGNYAASGGGGIYSKGSGNYIANCVVVSNRTGATGVWSDIHSTTDSNTNYYYYCCSTGVLFAPNQGNMTDDPLFVNSGAGNWRLAANSPCINKGTNMNWMTNAVDFDGRMRIVYGTVDMGAYEHIHEGTIYTAH